jgi:hypothetical protein
VLETASVPAGLTLMQALDREADVSTRYGGRFVVSIDGLEGDIGKRRDWFWFVNGIEGDRSAADYELRDGDIGWWDLRSWKTQMRVPVVVGAFPEPFLRGFAGRKRPAAVRHAPGRRAQAQRIAELIEADSVGPTSTPAAADANVFVLLGGKLRFTASLRDAGSAAGSPVRFVFAGDAAPLLQDPERFRFRYEVGS